MIGNILIFLSDITAFIFSREFFNSFLPNLISTLIGLLVGIPFALWINREALGHVKSLETDDEKKRANTALTTILNSININEIHLTSHIRYFEEGKAIFESLLDSSTWDAVKFEIIHHLRMPDLQSNIAYYFSKINAISILNNKHLDYTTGTTAVIGGAEKARDTMRAHLILRSKEMIKEGNLLREAIVKKISEKT